MECHLAASYILPETRQQLVTPPYVHCAIHSYLFIVIIFIIFIVVVVTVIIVVIMHIVIIPTTTSLIVT